ncbi:MAG: hypothetical protein ACRD1V_21620 [Vicinamibacterales bacterium]
MRSIIAAALLALSVPAPARAQAAGPDRSGHASSAAVLWQADDASTQATRPVGQRPPASARPATVRKKRRAGLFWISVNGGLQAAPGRTSDVFTKPLYVETETISVNYPSRDAVVIAASAGYVVWKHLAVAGGVTRASINGTASVSADLPHPFFFNQFRHIEGTAPSVRTELDANLMAAWVERIGPRFRLVVSGGPSAVNVNQTVVTSVDYMQTYPFDTATFTDAQSVTAAKTALGVNAGADLAWMFATHVGVGGLAQYVHARVKVNRGSDASSSIQLRAGGAQAGVGIRFVF